MSAQKVPAGLSSSGYALALCPWIPTIIIGILVYLVFPLLSNVRGLIWFSQTGITTGAMLLPLFAASAILTNLHMWAMLNRVAKGNGQATEKLMVASLTIETAGFWATLSMQYVGVVLRFIYKKFAKLVSAAREGQNPYPLE